MSRLGSLFFLAFMALSACGGPRTEWHWEELAMSSPNHVDDWYQFYEAIQKEDVSCMAGPGALGTLTLDTLSGDFDRARQIALKIIQQNTLTMRLRKSTTGNIYETYQRGQKTGEEPH